MAALVKTIKTKCRLFLKVLRHFLHHFESLSYSASKYRRFILRPHSFKSTLLSCPLFSKFHRLKMFGFNFNYQDADQTFSATYKCYSISMLPDERLDLEKGGKIIMPPSALHTLTRLNTSYPMLFKLTNTDKKRHTHCGVLEFIAEEGKVYLPYWMMRNLLLDEGMMIQVQSASEVPVATYSKFQPQSVDFLDITNPKAVLENGLRNFACLTTGDVIAINYNNKVYELCVLETRPGNAVSIIECDMNVDFEAPVGYQEPERKPKTEDHESAENAAKDAHMIDLSKAFSAFSGQGNRLDGKAPKLDADNAAKPTQREYRRGIPDYDYKIGTLKFWRVFRPAPSQEAEKANDFKAFLGEGHTLFKKK